MYGRKYDFLKRKCDGLEQRINELDRVYAMLADSQKTLAGKVKALRDHLGVSFIDVGITTIGGKKYDTQSQTKPADPKA